MKRARTLVAIYLLLATAAVFAQTESQQLMKVKVPFPFDAENHSLPAGEYTIFTVTPERLIRITSKDGHHSAVVNTMPTYATEPSSKSCLVFQRYGNEYFLAQVWTAGQSVRRNAISSKRAMQLAKIGAPPRTTTVTALATGR